MDRIERLIPAAGREDDAGLRTVDPGVLARYVVDRSRPWWRRAPCARALAGRVPDAWLDRLAAVVRDPADTAEVRVALLGALPNRADLLSWLRHPDRAAERGYRVPEAVLLARGRLGDRTAVPELVALADDPWPHRRDIGAEALDALVARYGVHEILTHLDPARPADRAFALRMRHRDGGDVTDALADPDTGVAYLAHTLADDEPRLRAFLDTAPTVDAALWALCALHRHHGADITAHYERLGRPRVEVPGLDEDVRAAIRAHFVPGSQRTTDPRWRVENVHAADPAPYTGEASAYSSDRGPAEAARLDRVAAALAGAGLAPAPPVPCGEDYGSGGGTYYVVATPHGTVDVCALGPFVTGDGDDAPAAREALEAAGLRWIDASLGTVRVDGLDVYYFGNRGPLTVGALLFYWQD